MTAQGHALSALHGRNTPKERDTLIDAFREGKTKVLIATNVLARGIDILQVGVSVCSSCFLVRSVCMCVCVYVCVCMFVCLRGMYVRVSLFDYYF
jgi:late competence protein required for DNA uptake (superfamily II DNA/RNA helicase)